MDDIYLSVAEQKTLVELLSKLKPGFLPFDIFLQLARLVVLPIVEFVPLRLNNEGQVEVLLLSREQDDPLWPGELHVPGTVVRPNDTEEKMYMAFGRILNDELKGTEVSPPHFVGNILHKSKRGTEQAQVFWVEVLGNPNVGEFYAVDALPSNVMDSQRDFIRQAAKSFINYKS